MTDHYTLDLPVLSGLVHDPALDKERAALSKAIDNATPPATPVPVDAVLARSRLEALERQTAELEAARARIRELEAKVDDLESALLEANEAYDRWYEGP